MRPCNAIALALGLALSGTAIAAETNTPPVPPGSRNITGFSKDSTTSHATPKSGECAKHKHDGGKCKSAGNAPIKNAYGKSSGDSATVRGQVDNLDRGKPR